MKIDRKQASEMRIDRKLAYTKSISILCSQKFLAEIVLETKQWKRTKYLEISNRDCLRDKTMEIN